MAYVYPDAEKLQHTPLVGSHQCVALVQFYADAPSTSFWREGERVRGNAALLVGTAIATFFDGRYPNFRHGNHAAFYLGQDEHGVYVMDQWANDARRKPFVSRRCLVFQGKDEHGNYRDPSNNGDAFSVIERV